MTTVPIDVHDVSNCPLGHRCESCGAEAEGLALTTASTPLGVFCVTLCPRDLASGIAPPIALSTAVRLVLAHCGHLGIDADDMADVLAGEQATR